MSYRQIFTGDGFSWGIRDLLLTWIMMYIATCNMLEIRYVYNSYFGLLDFRFLYLVCPFSNSAVSSLVPLPPFDPLFYTCCPVSSLVLVQLLVTLLTRIRRLVFIYHRFSTLLLMPSIFGKTISHVQQPLRIENMVCWKKFFWKT